METHWHTEADSGGIAWLHLKIAGSSTNVLSAGVFAELNELLSRYAAKPPAGVIFLSDNPGGFIAGADIKEFEAVRGHEDALAIVRRGQQTMDCIEALPCPTVAAIHGFCLGGGLELALACDYRVATDEPATRLGLPEIRLGIHPGFGGTMRSIRLLGALTALQLMLTGNTISAQQAKKIGLVDHAVPRRHLLRAARQMIEAKAAVRRPSHLARILNSRAVRPMLARVLKRRVAAKGKPEHYPAPYALIDLWRRHAGDDRLMLEREAESVAALSLTVTARNLVRVFMLQNRLKAMGDKRAFRPRHVHVIGAGTMGGDIAAWVALQGFRVTVQDQRADSLAGTMRRASKLFIKQLKSQRRTAAAMDRLIPDHKGMGLKHADVVIEAIFEDVEAKRSLYRDLEASIKPDTLLATNTSSLPIERLTEGLSNPGRLIGLHFFNPVAQMPLVEIVRGPCSHDEMIVKALAFARHIDKLPLETRSSTGFLVNRVLAPYLLEAILMVEEGIPVVAVDRAAKDFGMLMGPLEMADAVGLDVVLSAGETLGAEYGFKAPERLRATVAAGDLGRKSGKGFYPYKGGQIVRSKRLNGSRKSGPTQERLISKMIDEAVACLRDRVVGDADLIDAGIIFGAGFAPFRGGPLHYRTGGS